MDYNTTIKIPRKELETINSYFNLTGKELYDKCSLTDNTLASYTAGFSDEFEAEIKVVIKNEDCKPHIEAVLFDDSGSSLVTMSPIKEPLDGDYYLELVIDGYNNDYYCVSVESL